MPLPLAMMIPFMGIQSAVMAKQFGENFQFGKRRISAMSNEEFNALTPKILQERANQELKDMIPSMEDSIKAMTDFQTFLIKEFIRMIEQLINEGLGALLGLDQGLTQEIHEFLGHPGHEHETGGGSGGGGGGGTTNPHVDLTVQQKQTHWEHGHGLEIGKVTPFPVVDPHVHTSGHPHVGEQQAPFYSPSKASDQLKNWTGSNFGNEWWTEQEWNDRMQLIFTTREGTTSGTAEWYKLNTQIEEGIRWGLSVGWASTII